MFAVTSLTVALLLQVVRVTPPAAAPAAPASVSGVAVNAATGEPLANVRVSLARTDLPLGAFAEMLATDRPPVEMTLSGDMLALIGRDMAGQPAGAENSEAAAFAALPIDQIHELIVGPVGGVTIITKSAPPILTDSEGRFAFNTVAPGTYRLIFARNGFAKMDYGQRVAGGGVPIRMAAGQSKNDIVMRMMPTSAVSGRLRNIAGQPLAGVPVQLFRFTYDETGQRKPQNVGTAETNDRGEFRMFYLSPGRYFISAGGLTQAMTSESAMMLMGLAQQRPSTNRIPETHSLTYFPGTPDVNRAAVVDIPPGAELSGIDMVLEPMRSYAVRGRIVDSRTGQQPPNASITLDQQVTDPVARELAMMSDAVRPAPNYNPATGTFEVRNVSPGDYVVSVSLPMPRAPESAGVSPTDRTAALMAAEANQARARVPVSIVNRDIENFVVQVGTGFSIAARVRVDPAATAGNAPTLSFLRTQLKGLGDRALGMDNGPRANPPQPDGTFKINEVWPGEYRLNVVGMPSGYFVKEARLGDSDLLNAPFRISGPDSNVLEILISPNTGGIEGRALDAQGQPVPGAQVVLIPEGKTERTDLFRPVVADAAGRFSIPNVAPSPYKLVAWEALEPFAFFDPALLRQAEELGRSVRIAESSKQVFDVPVIPVGQ